MSLQDNPDVIYCACIVAADLIPSWWSSQPTWYDLCLLAEQHGGAPLIDPGINVERAAKCNGGEIILSPWLSMLQYRELVPHELVHCLADTPGGPGSTTRSSDFATIATSLSKR